jgi:hypothetical protein
MGLVSFRWFYFAPSLLLRLPPGIWRPFTAYCITAAQLGIILDPYFVYQYTKELEVGNTRFPRMEDLLWYFLTVGTMIIVSFLLFAELVAPCSRFPPPSKPPSTPRVVSLESQCTCTCTYTYTYTSAYLPA